MRETPHKTLAATVANGGTKSAGVDITGFALCGVILPSTLDGTTLSFEVSTDDTTYYVLRDTAGDISLTVAASRAVALDPALFSGFQYVKIVLATQSTTDTNCLLAVRPI